MNICNYHWKGKPKEGTHPRHDVCTSWERREGFMVPLCSGPSDYGYIGAGLAPLGVAFVYIGADHFETTINVCWKNPLLPINLFFSHLLGKKKGPLILICPLVTLNLRCLMKLCTHNGRRVSIEPVSSLYSLISLVKAIGSNITINSH